MTTHDELDLHQLDLRFAASRLIVPGAVDALARSIEQSGQLVPCIAVREAGAARLILIDGYRRIDALRRLGRDTARIEAWSCPLTQGLLSFFARHGQRPLAAIEEGLLLQELVQGQGLTQQEVARHSGRNASWVSRRLELVCGLPDDLWQAVRAGTVSSWAATRILAPLARANSAHASAVLATLKTTPLSTRALVRWFEHYRCATRAIRERMVAQPHLFLQSLTAAQESQTDTRVREGPEGQWERDLHQLQALIQRLHPSLPQIVGSDGFTDALSRVHTTLTRFVHDLTPEP